MGRPPLDPVERYWSKVVKTDSCWIWQEKPKSSGHGYFWNGTSEVPAHRFAWELLGNPIPEAGWWSPVSNLNGWELDHDDDDTGCHNKLCVNPAHLVVVSHRRNSQRKRANNTSGFVGVYQHKASGRYVAQVWIAGNKFHFGYHDTAEEAAAARAAGIRILEGNN